MLSSQSGWMDVLRLAYRRFDIYNAAFSHSPQRLLPYYYCLHTGGVRAGLQRLPRNAAHLLLPDRAARLPARLPSLPRTTTPAAPASAFSRLLLFSPPATCNTAALPPPANIVFSAITPRAFLPRGRRLSTRVRALRAMAHCLPAPH